MLRPYNGYIAEATLKATVAKSIPNIQPQKLNVSGSKLLASVINYAKSANNRHLTKKINYFLDNNSVDDIIMADEILDYILSTDIIIKVNGITIAIDLTLNTDSYKLGIKKAYHQSIYPYMRRLGVEKMIVLVWSNDIALTPQHLLALVNENNFSSVTI